MSQPSHQPPAEAIRRGVMLGPDIPSVEQPAPVVEPLSPSSEVEATQNQPENVDFRHGQVAEDQGAQTSPPEKRSGIVGRVITATGAFVRRYVSDAKDSSPTIMPSAAEVDSMESRYTPSGYLDRMRTLRVREQEVVDSLQRLERRLPRDIAATIRREVSAGKEVPIGIRTSHEDVPSYIERVKTYGALCAAERAEKQDADMHLLRLAESLFPDPPRNAWGVVGREAQKGSTGEQVPFTPDEIMAIKEARIARLLIAMEIDGSKGAESHFLSESQFFPQEVGQNPLAMGMEDRSRAIMGIMEAARAAENALTLYQDTAWQPSPESTLLLSRVRDLPYKLVSH